MTQELVKHLKSIDKLQGLIHQNLMESFNSLSELAKGDFADVSNIGNLQHFKHAVLSRLSNATEYINGPQFKAACVTCKAVRILGLLKYAISSKYLSAEEQKEAVGEAITDYKIDKKYTENFYTTTKDVKEQIVKIITSKQLRKKFHLNDFCLQLLNKERNVVNESFPEDKEIKLPEWMDKMNKEELDQFAEQVINSLEEQNYERFMEITKEK